MYQSTSLRLSCCAISTRSERAGRTQRLAGKSCSRRAIVSTAAARSCPWCSLCASQKSASSLFGSFGHRPPRPSARRSRAATARRRCSPSRARAASSPVRPRPPRSLPYPPASPRSPASPTSTGPLRPAISGSSYHPQIPVEPHHLHLHHEVPLAESTAARARAPPRRRDRSSTSRAAPSPDRTSRARCREALSWAARRYSRVSSSSDPARSRSYSQSLALVCSGSRATSPSTTSFDRSKCCSLSSATARCRRSIGGRPWGGARAARAGDKRRRRHRLEPRHHEAARRHEQAAWRRSPPPSAPTTVSRRAARCGRQPSSPGWVDRCPVERSALDPARLVQASHETRPVACRRRVDAWTLGERPADDDRSSLSVWRHSAHPARCASTWSRSATSSSS